MNLYLKNDKIVFTYYEDDNPMVQLKSRMGEGWMQVGLTLDYIRSERKVKMNLYIDGEVGDLNLDHEGIIVDDSEYIHMIGATLNTS